MTFSPAIKAFELSTSDTRGVVGDWTVSWEGKSRVVLPASSSSTKSVPNPGVVERSEDSDNHDAAEGVVHRLYFLLPPGERVPGVVTLTLTARDDKSGASEYAEGSGAVSVVTTWQTNVLPAIFPQDKSTLSPSSSLGGKTGEKGILHTIWAKKRLRVLAAEIAAEEKCNAESVGLDMAVQEKDWIMHHFGLGGSTSETGTAGTKQSSRATSPAAVVGRDEKRLEVHSPPGEDIAVGAFEDFVRHAGVQGPKVLGVKASQRVSDVVTASTEDDKEDGLFALPMSPRTPLSAGSK